MSTNSALVVAGVIVFGYLAGSVSPSVFLGKLFRGIDVREHASGNAGTTNAFRVLGVKLGIAVLTLDIVKGVVPVLLARYLHCSPLVTVFVALACIAGHNYSVLLLVLTHRGQGGKGVATGAGAALAMMPIPMAFVVSLFIILVFTVRVVSIASITCTVLFPVCAVVLRQPLPYLIACCVISALVLWAHRRNFKRLWRHEEKRVVFPWNKKAPPPAPVGDPPVDGRAAGDGQAV